MSPTPSVEEKCSINPSSGSLSGQPNGESVYGESFPATPTRSNKGDHSGSGLHLVSGANGRARLPAATFALTSQVAMAIFPRLATGGNSMKSRSLTVRIAVIANAILITVAFVGCPARKDPAIMPTPIAPPPPPFVTIAPYGGNVQHLLPSDQTPSLPSKDSRNQQPSP